MSGQLFDAAADALADIVMGVLDKHDDRTALGEFEIHVCKILAKNRFNDKEFNTLVDTFVNNIEYYEDLVMRGQRVDRTIDDEVFKVYEGYLALLAKENKMFDALSDKDYNWCMDVIESPVGEFIQTAGTRSHRGRGRDDRYSRGRYDAGGGRYQDDSPRDRYNTGERTYSQARGVYSGRATQVDPRRVVADDDAYVMTRRDIIETPPTPVQPSRQRHFHDDEPDLRRSPQPQSRPEPVPHVEPDIPAWVSGDDVPKVVCYTNPTGFEGPDHTKEDPYGDFWENGKHYQVAYTSEWKLTYRGIHTLEQLINIHTEVLYKVKDQYGDVSQEIRPLTNENRYLNQCLYDDPAVAEEGYYRNRFPLKKKPVSDTSEPDDSFSIEPKPEEVTLSSVMKELDPDELTQLPDPLVCDSLDLAILETRAMIEPDSSIACKTFVVRDPIEFVTPEQAEFVKRLTIKPTITGLAEALKENPERIPLAPLTKLCNKISEYILDLTTHEYGNTVLKMKFPEHWEKLLKWLSDKNGAQWTMDYTRTLNSKIIHMLHHIDFVEPDGSITDAFEDIIKDTNFDRVIGYVEHVAIISIDKTVDELSIGKQLELYDNVMISPTTNEKEAQSIYTRLRALSVAHQYNPITKIIIATKDGRTIRIRPIPANDGRLVLNLVKL